MNEGMGRKRRGEDRTEERSRGRNSIIYNILIEYKI
jgi:hypothetical protein